MLHRISTVSVLTPPFPETLNHCSLMSNKDHIVAIATEYVLGAPNTQGMSCPLDQLLYSEPNLPSAFSIQKKGVK